MGNAVFCGHRGLGGRSGYSSD